LGEYRGVLLRSTVRELATAESGYGVHVRDFKRVGGVPKSLMPVFLKWRRFPSKASANDIAAVPAHYTSQTYKALKP